MFCSEDILATGGGDEDVGLGGGLFHRCYLVALASSLAKKMMALVLKILSDDFGNLSLKLASLPGER